MRINSLNSNTQRKSVYISTPYKIISGNNNSKYSMISKYSSTDVVSFKNKYIKPEITTEGETANLINKYPEEYKKLSQMRNTKYDEPRFTINDIVYLLPLYKENASLINKLSNLTNQDGYTYLTGHEIANKVMNDKNVLLGAYEMTFNYTPKAEEMLIYGIKPYMLSNPDYYKFLKSVMSEYEFTELVTKLLETKEKSTDPRTLEIENSLEKDFGIEARFENDYELAFRTRLAILMVFNQFNENYLPKRFMAYDYPDNTYSYFTNSIHVDIPNKKHLSAIMLPHNLGNIMNNNEFTEEAHNNGIPPFVRNDATGAILHEIGVYLFNKDLTDKAKGDITNSWEWFRTFDNFGNNDLDKVSYAASRLTYNEFVGEMFCYKFGLRDIPDIPENITEAYNVLVDTRNKHMKNPKKKLFGKDYDVSK